MSANLKKIKLDKIEKINKQINLLKQKQNKIYQQLEIKLLQILKKQNAFNYDFEILTGMILDNLSKLETEKIEKDTLENWKKLGSHALKIKAK